ncbi:lysM domain receptor-like kinase 3 [Canna indica]|uniref:LysM domain receptor-like kinase 3 n=1 Tax=Canna indica TaxID=4628 RepID=A0AAQ3JSS7_9LILI|nr:lysM domain receptor-like kinase 3 [Canna indica]
MTCILSGHGTCTGASGVTALVIFPFYSRLRYSCEEAYRFLPPHFPSQTLSFPSSLPPSAFASPRSHAPASDLGVLLPPRWSILCLMCKSKSAVDASNPRPRSRSRSSSANNSATATSSGAFPTGSSSDPRLPRAPAFNSFPSSGSKVSSSSHSSLSSLREALPEALVLYTFSEIRSTTGDFRSNCLPGTSSGWRCTLRGKDAVVFQRRYRGPDPAAIQARLATLARSHHSSLVPLLGASIVGDHVYLVHEFAPGATLDDCLRNPRNPSFTPLSTWISRMQIASDIAYGLEYIHFHSSVTAGIHNRLKSSSVIITDPGFCARICHFGATDLAGEIPAASEEDENGESNPSTSAIRRTGSRRMRIEGSRDYMAPELFAGGSISRQSDVFAFGVVLLEIISGAKPVERREFERVSLIDTAREAIGAEDGERRGRVRKWVDRRLRDSFPVETAEALIQVAIRCLEADPAARPDMTWVAGMVSKLFLDSKAWADAVKHPTDISVSIAPR